MLCLCPTMAGISFIYGHKLHSLPTFEEYPQTTKFFYGRCMVNKEKERWVQKTVLKCVCVFFLLIFMQRKNRLLLGQVLWRWTFCGSGFNLLVFWGGITICLHSHIPVTFILPYHTHTHIHTYTHTHTHTHTHTPTHTHTHTLGSYVCDV